MPAVMALFPYDVTYGGGGAAATALKANQACYSCRKQKRKCDKALPSCGLCSRMGRDCDYSEAQPTPTAEDLAALQLKLAQLESRLNHAGGSDIGINQLGTTSASASQSGHTPQLLPQEPLWQNGTSRFPAAAFLDSRLFRWNGLRIPEPIVEIPLDVLQCIGNADDMEQTLSDYFGDIHPWCPMVSRKRMSMSLQLRETGGDVALLILAMKLITSQPQRGFASSDNYLYTACKRYATLLESVGSTSLQYVQALVLVALYEHGQAIYPAAWMTVGQCVRYADYLGLSSYTESSAVLGHPLTWADTEERRRVWWAIYIIDKVVSLGSYKRALCSEPLPDDSLPTDDKLWDNSDCAVAYHRPVSALFSEPQSAFARVCQSALLASKALQHHADVEQCKLTGGRFDFSAVANIRSSAEELCESMQVDFAASTAEYYCHLAARSIAYTAVVKVLDLYASAEPIRGVGAEWDEEEMAQQMSAMEGIRNMAMLMRNIAVDLYSHISLDEEIVKTTPMILNALYLASIANQNEWKESRDPLAEPNFDITRKCIVRLSERWRLGKEFLDLLELHGMSFMGRGFESSDRLAGIPLVIPGMA